MMPAAEIAAIVANCTTRGQTGVVRRALQRHHVEPASALKRNGNMGIGRVQRRLAGPAGLGHERLLDIAPQIAQKQLDQEALRSANGRA